jgi:outer membrane protein OmpA-like peptidoglycan-associated protein
MFKVKVLPVLGFAAISLVVGCGTSETALKNSSYPPVDMVSMASPLSSKFRSEIVTVVHFEFDNDELDATALRIIEDQAAWILDNPNIRFSVIGHTDRVGNNSYNMDLGMRRADRVVAALVAMGVNELQLLAEISKGEEENIIETEDRERANRRVLTEVMGLMPNSSSSSFIRNDDDDNSNSDRRRRNPISEALEGDAPEEEATEEAAEEETTEVEATEVETTEVETTEEETTEVETTDEEATEVEAPEVEAPLGGNPGNEEGVGRAGENPNGSGGWGNGSIGNSG